MASVPTPPDHFNDQQKDAYNKVMAYLQDEDEAPFTFVGLAGTGKTTVITRLIGDLVEREIIDPERIAVMAYTGKAASVLNKKIGTEVDVVATTIHSIIYTMPIDAGAKISKQLDTIEAEMDKEEKVVALKALKEHYDALLAELHAIKRSTRGLDFVRRDSDEINEAYDLIIVDEASMVDPEIAKHIHDANVKTIYVGDPNQLPPVGKPFGVKFAHPNTKLTQIMRQKGDSGIVPLAHDVLKSRGLPIFTSETYDNVVRDRGTNPLRFVPDLSDVKTVPQFVCYFNQTRHSINHAIRTRVLGVDTTDYYNFVPGVGEYVMLDANLAPLRLMKGDLLKIVEIAQAGLKPGRKLTDADDKSKKTFGDKDLYNAVAKVENAYGGVFEMNIFLNDLMLAMRHPMALDVRDKHEYRLHGSMMGGSIPVMFPYAITAYKAQGSEWDSVVVINEKPRDNYVAYMYTAITRARNKLVVAG